MPIRFFQIVRGIIPLSHYSIAPQYAHALIKDNEKWNDILYFRNLISFLYDYDHDYDYSLSMSRWIFHAFLIQLIQCEIWTIRKVLQRFRGSTTSYSIVIIFHFVAMRGSSACWIDKYRSILHPWQLPVHICWYMPCMYRTGTCRYLQFLTFRVGLFLHTAVEMLTPAYTRSDICVSYRQL